MVRDFVAHLPGRSFVIHPKNKLLVCLKVTELDHSPGHQGRDSFTGRLTPRRVGRSHTQAPETRVSPRAEALGLTCVASSGVEGFQAGDRVGEEPGLARVGDPFPPLSDPHVAAGGEGAIEGVGTGRVS